MGRLGERHRGARAGHARHVPCRRLFASWRQYPAGAGGGADRGQIRSRSDPRHCDWLRNSHQPREGHLPARAQDRPYRASVPGAGGRHRHTAWVEAGHYLSGGAAGAACQHHHPSVAQGRNQLLEGVRASACRQARHRSGGPRNARGGRSQPDLRRRRQRDCVDTRWPAGALPGAAAGPRRSQARHHGQLYQGTFGRVSVAGVDRPGVPHAFANFRFRRDRENRHPHQPSHPLRDRHRCERSAEDGPEGQPRNVGPFDHVYLRRGLAGRHLEPC